MKTEKSILIAFILNLSLSIFELIGGIFTGSTAIISDSVHDMGDATSIGISYFLEKKSKGRPNAQYTYGYARYSVMGSLITTLILLLGSAIAIFNAIYRIIFPSDINYDGMILFAIIGVCVNFCAAFFTRNGHTLNQKAVNLHMFEDLLGWITVLIGAVIMRFTHITILDPLMSVGVALFIIVFALKNLKKALDILLEKTPDNIDIGKIRERVMEVEGVLDVHHIHVRSIDGECNCATMHIVTDGEADKTKEAVRDKLHSLGISHTTLELEASYENCHQKNCFIELKSAHRHHHHHRHS